MLKSLFIRNFVLIDSLDIKFDKGFSVITGETGAGKSIILGALSLVLGQRADGKSIKNGSEKCVIEAVFDVSRYKLEEFFLTNDLEYDAEVCILRRELFASGKSRAFVNDSPVPLSVVKELGSRLIDIHSQHQNLLLGDNRFQLKVIDVMAENDILLILYRKEYSRYLFLKKELKELTEKALQTKQEEDYVRFQLEQLTDAGLVAGEQEELEQELETLSHAEEIKGSLYKITQLLDGEEQGAVQLIKEALSTADSLERYYPKAKEIAERLRSAYIDMNDLEIETMRSSGAGGQHINKTDSAVRIVHKPTGIVVKCQDGRSQHENRATALMTIRARVYEERQRELDQKNEKERRTKIGTGDRAEKIRTYNYPQNRVTDHRIGYTVNQLDRIMDGRLDDLMAALQLADQQAKIAGEKE